jgi:pSer/pThr/pTyr-binding forkhead associated (FHA) protein
MAKLEIHRAKERLRDFFFPDADVLTIGRTQSSDIVLADNSQRISRYHAALVRLTADPGGYFVRDLRSLLGTRANGQLVYQRVLNDGDVIDIADYRLIYSAISERRTRVHRIKPVSRKVDELSLDRSTHAMKLDGLSSAVSLTEEQRELLEQFH